MPGRLRIYTFASSHALLHGHGARVHVGAEAEDIWIVELLEAAAVDEGLELFQTRRKLCVPSGSLAGKGCRRHSGENYYSLQVDSPVLEQDDCLAVIR